MDTAMRDMEQIEERDELDQPGRRVAMLAMAAISTVGLVFAMGILLGRSAEVESEVEPDPLAALDDALVMAPGAADEPEAESVTVDREEMTFHETLVGNDRPEVAAAMAAAAAELEHLDPLPSDLGGEDALAMGTYANVVPPGAPAQMAAPLPAPPEPAAEVAPAGNLAIEPIASASMEARAPRAEAGADGKYTLQVISYRTREEADVFAEALRARGHAAFVQTAEVPERGTYHRVRVGPFDSIRDAERYRSEFEAQERMNSFVVRRRD
jgi:DedD protein